MSIPLSLKRLAVFINEIKEEMVNKPQMIWIFSPKTVDMFKPDKECPPSARKLRSNLNPQTLNPGVMS